MLKKWGWTVGVVLLLAACNLPGVQETQEVPTATEAAPATEETSAPTAEPTEAVTDEPATGEAPTDEPTEEPSAGGPQRVQFEAGATSAVVEGDIAAGGEDEYLVNAQEGQEMTVELLTADEDIVIEVVSADGETLADASEGLTVWTGTLPASGDTVIRVISQADVLYLLEIRILPLGDTEVADMCTVTVNEALTIYRWPSTAEDAAVFGMADAGMEIDAQYETSDGWYGFDPAVAQAPNFGADKMRWFQLGDGAATLDENCPGLASALSFDQLANASYSAMDFPPVTLENGEYRDDGSDPASSQYTTIARDVMSYSDLDGDGDQDALVILRTNTGGSGTFVELVAVLNQEGVPEQAAKIMIGDREAINHMTVIDGVITIDARIHAEDDPLCCPSLDTTLYYRYEDGELVEAEGA